MSIELQKINEFIALKPRYFKFLKSISLTRNISPKSCSKYDIEIVLCQLDDNNQQLRIKFENAFDIKLNHMEGLFGLLIDIEDVSSMQLEGSKYRVMELEEGVFSFHCENFFTELVTVETYDP